MSTSHHLRSLVLLVALALALLFLGPHSTNADVVVLPVAEDSAPYSFLPALNRGSSASLYSFEALDESSTPHEFETYLWFDVEQSDLPPGHVLVEATLLVTYAFDFNGFGSSSNQPGELACREVLGPWSEATLTWSSRPAVDAPFDTQTGITGYGALLCNATPVVLDWMGNRAPNEGFALTSSTARVMGLHSRESSANPSFKPQLILRTELPEPRGAGAVALGSAFFAWIARREDRRVRS